MLGTLVLLMCLVAGVVAAGILFVVLGPVPVNRRVTMVSRIVPMPVAVGPVAMPGMPVFDPGQAQFTPARALPAVQAYVAQPIAAAVELPPPPPVRKARPAPPIAPLHVRRPRTAPAPLARDRAARGTERSPRQSFDLDHTAKDAPVFELEDVTFLEDGH